LKEHLIMRYWTALFLVLALFAGVMGLSGLGGLSLLSACGLFLAGLILALLSLLLAQKPELVREAGVRRAARSKHPSPRPCSGA
jgi:uncharacterized membrane protein YtjA (UPF0391 family)